MQVINMVQLFLAISEYFIFENEVFLLVVSFFLFVVYRYFKKRKCFKMDLITNI